MMDLGLHIAVYARKKSFLRHTRMLSLDLSALYFFGSTVDLNLARGTNKELFP
jgi:hypothetical protein